MFKIIFMQWLGAGRSGSEFRSPSDIKRRLRVDRHGWHPQSWPVMDRLTLMIVVAVTLAIVLGLVWWKRES